MTKEIKNSIHELRIKMRDTQEQLAKATGVTRQTIITLEQGNCVPSLLLAFKISSHFHKKIEQVFHYQK